MTWGLILTPVHVLPQIVTSCGFACTLTFFQYWVTLSGDFMQTSFDQPYKSDAHHHSRCIYRPSGHASVWYLYVIIYPASNMINSPSASSYVNQSYSFTLCSLSPLTVACCNNCIYFNTYPLISCKICLNFCLCLPPEWVPAGNPRTVFPFEGWVAGPI